MNKTKLAFVESEQFKKHSKSSNWLEKSRPSEKATFVLIMKTDYINQSIHKPFLLS